MLNYDNITIGLEVEFVVDDQLCEGFVRYKGPVNGKEGVWIGIEAKSQVGFCDGRIMGRTYFKCPDKYGLFLMAEDLRLLSKHNKAKRIVYKKKDSECDNSLFKHELPKEHMICITQDYLERAKSAFETNYYSDIFCPAPRYSTQETLIFSSKKKTDDKAKKAKENKESKEFHRVSSIQKSFMPKEEMKLYTKLNWSYKNVSPPKTNNLNNSFDGFNRSRSNYLNPTVH